ncbi:MAG: Peptidase S9 prolyl oligopeptidase active site domain protein [candidate division TM6 bacterium GW2011_GWF2_30_66]|nr:MAG: Peptidase S9 prolyl oligopeptidase active site domain protein [candidate division TM6 bacterium GW2011_GWF2_30_66]
MFEKNYFKITLFTLTILIIPTVFYLIYPKSNHIPLKVLFGTPAKSGLKISPDGKKLSYLAPTNGDGMRNIWVKTIGQDDDRAITIQKERDIVQYIWAFDNEHLFYIQDNNGDENYHIYKVNINTKETKDLTPFQNTRASFLSYEKHLPNQMIITLNMRNKKVFDVYKIDLKTDILILIAQNPGNIDSWLTDFSNNIKAATIAKPDGRYDALVKDNNNSNWRKIASWSLEEDRSKLLHFSRDGQFIYACDSRDSDTTRLVKINFKTGKTEVVFSDLNYDFDDIIKNQDTNELLAGYYQKEKKEWIFFNKKFESDMKLAMKLDTGDISLQSRDSQDKKWIIVFIKDNGPISYWLFDRETKKGEFLFYNMPELNKYKLANTEPISFISRDNIKINGYLTCPINKKCKNLPMVLFVHGGPWTRDNWGYNPVSQLFANRGYAVLQVNFRGSTGYGKNFLNYGNKQWGKNMQNDLTDAVNWAVSTGLANPKKVAIYGGSYGGYAALAGAALTPDIFCCAIDIVGPSNLITLLQSIPPYWSTGKYMFQKRVGDLETEKEFLQSISPLFHADKIKIPVMVVQGANDPRVKQAESEQIVEAMKKNGVNYEYLLFTDEGHGLLKEVNKLKFYQAAEKFLTKYLG